MDTECCLCGEIFNMLCESYITIGANKYVCEDCKHKAEHDRLVDHLRYLEKWRGRNE